MLQVPPSPVPCISVSFAPHELTSEEPKSPFASGLPAEPDSPRPQHLLPPPAVFPNQTLRVERHGQLSPLSPPPPGGGKGLERARFEAMLKASKDRSAMVGAKKPVELRKEIAMKAQKAKQFERRALFLSKLAAPPSPSAAEQPVTPPDSPAIFHFTLPSPGLESPLELFESMANHPELYQDATRIEQVDFRVPHRKLANAPRPLHSVTPTRKGTRPLPSLDQISQRLSKGPAPIHTIRSPTPEQGWTGASRLPSFLRNRSPSPPASEPIPAAIRPLPKDQAPKRPRLVLPSRAASKPIALAIHTPTPSITKMRSFPELPLSPKSPRPSKLQITTTLCPPSRSKSSPTEFTEENIVQFSTEHSAMPHRATPPTLTEHSHVSSQRAEATKDMFYMLSRRRPGLPGATTCGVRAQDDTSPMLSPSTEDKLRRRTSAPAEMSTVQRYPLHPVLQKPGGF